MAAMREYVAAIRVGAYMNDASAGLARAPFTARPRGSVDRLHSFGCLRRDLLPREESGRAACAAPPLRGAQAMNGISPAVSGGRAGARRGTTQRLQHPDHRVDGLEARISWLSP